MAMENPFANLRPPLRSEEDEIRKGVFSQALRNLQQAPLDERRRWCKAIREATAPRRGARAKKAAGASKATGTTVEGSISSSPSVAAPSPSSATPPSGDAMPGHKRARSEDRTAVGEAHEETEESVKECIAAYMRSLLDRVVGTGIDNLSVAALKVLCMMLDIRTEVSNKLGLYSILADFYFSKCAKLGKRVSRDTIFERQVQQEMAMLRHVSSFSTSSSTTGAERKTPNASDKAPAVAAATAQPTAASSTTNPTSSTTKKEAPAVRKRKADVGAVPKPTRTVPKPTAIAHPDASVQHYLQYEHFDGGDGVEHGDDVASLGGDDADDDGEVVYQQPVFQRASETAASAAASRQFAKYAEDKEDTWSLPLLERKVASIVQLYDPVTVAIVVKKLAQMGYREGGAESLVEQVLRRFHERQLIFYDNGIAYLT